VNPANISDAGEIERGVAAFGRAPNGGLIVTPVGATLGLERSRDLITTLAARHKLPAVYWDHFFAATGGLISYGADYIDRYRLAGINHNAALPHRVDAMHPWRAPPLVSLRGVHQSWVLWPARGGHLQRCCLNCRMRSLSRQCSSLHQGWRTPFPHMGI
jgi:hypothetical protein